MHFPIAGVEVNPLALVLIGFTVGICGAFFGIGGAFMVTPALNLFGFPMAYAIGTDLAHTMGKSIVATLKHRLLGNIDFKLGGLMIPGTVAGVEIGKRLILHLERIGRVDAIVRYTYVLLLGSIGLLIIWELLKNRHHKQEADGQTPAHRIAHRVQRIAIPPLLSLPKSRISHISLWAILGVGFATGFAASFLGVGGGFIRVPALIYVLGVPTLVAIGTDLFEIIISSGYGAFTYAVAGRVDILAALIMLLGAGVGAHIGAVCTSYVGSVRIRFYFSLAVLMAAASVLLKQLSVSLGKGTLGTTASYLIVVSAVIISVVIILTALLQARRKRQQHINILLQLQKSK